MKHEKMITGNVIFDPTDDYSEVEEITGFLDVRYANAEEAFPRLAKVGGYLCAKGAKTNVEFTALKSIGKSLYVAAADVRAAFPALESVGGSLDAYDADAKGAFPALESVGGYLDITCSEASAAFQKLTKVGGPVIVSGANADGAFPRCLNRLSADKEQRGGRRMRDIEALRDGLHGLHLARMSLVGEARALRIAGRKAEREKVWARVEELTAQIEVTTRELAEHMLRAEDAAARSGE